MDNSAPLLQLVPDSHEPEPSKESPPELVSDLWADFWTLYPRHEAKKDARKSWCRLSQSEQVRAIIAAADWRQVWRAQGRDISVIPLPATWLNGERWEDEIPEGIITARYASHAPAVVSRETVPRLADLPERVKALLAKLRKPGS